MTAPTGLPGAPAPRRAVDDRVESGAQLILARARLRGVPLLDVVSFTAACPACGADCEWTEHREDTRLQASVDCSCALGTDVVT